MSKTIIKVACVDQRLVVVDSPLVASGGVNEDVIQFEFCPLWANCEKVAIFYRNKEEAYQVAITDDQCMIPHEVLRDEGILYFGVIGIDGDVIRTSEVLKYTIAEGAVTDATTPADPTPDIYAQYIALYQTLERRVTNLEINGGGGGEGGGSGFSPTIDVTEISGGHRLEITDITGTTSVDVMDGKDGATGPAGSNGKDGTSVTVKSVSTSAADGGSNVVTFSDGKTLTVKNGSKGSAGAAGSNGKDGKTPVRGVDYWTVADQEAITQEVLAAMGQSAPVFGVVDADNNIILSGNIPDGVYTLKYEQGDGTKTEIGMLTVGSGSAEPTYTNLFDPAAVTLNKRMSGSNSAEKAADGYVMTAVIELPETVTSRNTYDDSTPFMLVPAAMWSGSANMFTWVGGFLSGYCDANATPGTRVGDWMKVPIYNQWADDDGAIHGVKISLHVKDSAIAASDIQNIKIYFNEIPE